MYKILIVEDDLTIAKTVREHLMKWDYQVYCVSDFKRVEESVSKTQPHLILLDILLPFYNGFHWCSRIPPDLKGTCDLSVVGKRQYEYCDGDEHGRR